MTSKKELDEIRLNIQELQAKIEAIYSIVQHLCREFHDLGMDIELLNQLDEKVGN
jgi:hypothetical protein